MNGNQLIKPALLMLSIVQVCCATSPWRDFKPESGTAIVGRVIDPQGRPIQSVQVSTEPETDTEFTDAKGLFAIQFHRLRSKKGKASTVEPIPAAQYKVFIDKSLYLPMDPVIISYRQGVHDIGDIVLTPERVELDLGSFRPTESDPVLPSEASKPKKD